MTKVLSKYVEAVKLGAQIDVRVPQNGSQVANKIILVPIFETEQVVNLTATSTSMTLFIPDNASGTYQVASVSSRFGTASSSGTVQIEVAGAGVAVGSGTNQLTATLSLAGTANTTSNATVIATPTVFGPGQALNIILAGTLTGLANGAVIVALQRVS